MHFCFCSRLTLEVCFHSAHIAHPMVRTGAGNRHRLNTLLKDLDRQWESRWSRLVALTGKWVEGSNISLGEGADTLDVFNDIC